MRAAGHMQLSGYLRGFKVHFYALLDYTAVVTLSAHGGIPAAKDYGSRTEGFPLVLYDDEFCFSMHPKTAEY